ncbi:ArsR/SmtB family transcription factor, partial [Mycetocola reblochoni]
MDGTSTPELAATAALLANETRASMLVAMLDGRAWTPTELARGLAVSPPTVTEHLHRLVDAGLLVENRQGRHRYVRIADPAVAEMVEALAAFSAVVRPAEHSWSAQRADRALREARSCYRHLAGRLGVALCDGLRSGGQVDGTWALTESGRTWFAGIGVDLPAESGRPLLRPCMDWTERREHLAGPAADALLATLTARGWLLLGPARRELRLSAEGRAGL